jgi:Rrf2 family protein
MLSQKTRYAIRAMQHLADHFGKGPVQLADIAEAQKIPPKFLTVILSELTRSGLVASQRGKDGGYWLGVAPIDISYGNLIRIMRGSLALVPCASRYAHEKCKNCVEEENCRTRALMDHAYCARRPTEQHGCGGRQRYGGRYRGFRKAERSGPKGAPQVARP